jgi:hypothetical protein
MRDLEIVKKLDATNMLVRVGTPTRFNAYTELMQHHKMKTLHIHLIS